MKRTRTFKHGVTRIRSVCLTDGTYDEAPQSKAPVEYYRSLHASADKTRATVSQIESATGRFMRKVILGTKQEFPEHPVIERNHLTLAWEGCTTIVNNQKKEIYFRRRAS